MALTGSEMIILANLVKQTNASQQQVVKDIIEDMSGSHSNTVSSLTFKVGQVVRLKPRKTKPSFTGTIERINSKSITVIKCSNGDRGWRMRPENLEHVTE